MDPTVASEKSRVVKEEAKQLTKTALMKEKDRLLKSISCEDAEDEQSVIPKWSSSELPMNGVGYNVIARLAHETGVVRLGDVEKPCRNANGVPIMKMAIPKSQSQDAMRQMASVELDEIAPREGTTKPKSLEELSSEELLELSSQLTQARESQSGDLLISGKAGKHNVDFLVDTGACISAISLRLWNRMRWDKVPPKLLPYQGTIVSVSGEEVNVVGHLLWIEIEERFYLAQCLVFDMGKSADAILGLDFIKRYQLDWNARLGHVTLRSEQNKSRTVHEKVRSCKLVCAKRALLPARSHVIVYARKTGVNAEL